MAFNINFFQRASDGVGVGLNSQWIYSDPAEAIATITTAGYFNSVNGIVNATPANENIKVGDLIWVVCSDYTGYTLVDTADDTIDTAQFDVVLGPGAVGTANLADDAVTTAKIADAAVTAAKLAPGAVDTAAISPDLLQYAAVPISAAQWNGMYAAPHLLVAAGGANTLLLLDSVTFEVDYGTTQYAAGGVVGIQYSNTIHGAGTPASATVAAATVQGWAADALLRVNGLLGNSGTAGVVNTGLYISNLTGAFTTGDSPIVAHVKYFEVATTF